ncbi:ATP-binding cassette, sub-B (MDR TAP), member 4, partial [Chytridiales sp. JEL 0842]
MEFIEKAKKKELRREMDHIHARPVVVMPGAADEKMLKDQGPVVTVDAQPVPPMPASYFKLFRYATAYDILLMTVGSLAGMVTGISDPIMTIFLADVLQAFITHAFLLDNDKLISDVISGVIKLTVIGAIVLVSAYLQSALWSVAAANQIKRIRSEYLKAYLKQDMVWLDSQKGAEVTSRLTVDVGILQDGMSEKVGLFFQGVACFIAGFAVAMIKGWRLALVLTSSIPLLSLVVMLTMALQQKQKGEEADVYASAGVIAHEILSSLRTVHAFNGQNRDLVRYSEKLKQAATKGIKLSFLNGLSIGAMMLVLFSFYGLGFWYGGTLIPATMTADQVITVFL